jgi:hypothetical protein
MNTLLRESGLVLAQGKERRLRPNAQVCPKLQSPLFTSRT